MSSVNLPAISFGTIFALFYLYWNYNRDRQQGRLSATEALNLQNSVYAKLVQKYQKNKWDLSELSQTCTMINLGADMVNPYEFIYKQFAYLGHIQNCFYE